jgi:hypothetical protein
MTIIVTWVIPRALLIMVRYLMVQPAFLVASFLNLVKPKTVVAARLRR